MNRLQTYHIWVHGQIDESEINSRSPLQIKVTQVETAVARLTIRTDQSGLVGLIRHLHGLGLTLLSIDDGHTRPIKTKEPAPAARQPISRRRFLQTGGLLVATAGLTLCGMTALAPDPPPVYYPTFTYGENQMNNRLLVTYASANGSTAGVAAAIGETLGQNGWGVDVIPITEEPSLADYQAVLLGSAVQYGSWLPEAVQFVKTNQQALNSVPLALFTVHITNLGDDAQSRRNRETFLDEIRPLLQPVAAAFFAGKFDRRGAKLMLPNWLARLIPPLDFRKWDKIREWAAEVQPLLAAS